MRGRALLFACLLFQTSAFGTPSFPLTVLQSPSNYNGAGASVVITLTQPTAPGTFLGIGVVNDNNNGTISMSDNATGGGDTFVQVPNIRCTDGAIRAAEVWYVLKGNGKATTVTINTTGAGIGGVVYEILGMADLAVTDSKGAASTLGSGTTKTGPTLTTFSRACFGIAAHACATTVSNSNPPWTVTAVMNGNAVAFYQSNQIVTNDAVVFNLASAGTGCISTAFFISKFAAFVPPIGL